MIDELEKFWAHDAKRVADELMLPTGELGAVLIAAILVSLCLWEVPALLRPAADGAAGITMVDVRGAVPAHGWQLHHSG